ncbi:MAG: dihydroorotate dehydrogenase electron transfer subunit, partial [Selenomonas sp.]|nr:dihydroorotate dehydrogenase electron transfer subunit [Selenomonas sp.]
QPGEGINILGPLGHGFSLQAKRPLLVGGGMGLSPLLFCATAFAGKADVLMGGRTQRELFWEDIYAPHVHSVYCTTDDGSYGEKGFVTTVLPKLLQANDYDLVLVCGPEVMMKAVAKIASDHNIPCQVSLEKRMGCGLGACLSCSIDTTNGQRKKVCKDGPVFWAEEVFDLS